MPVLSPHGFVHDVVLWKIDFVYQYGAPKMLYPRMPPGPTVPVGAAWASWLTNSSERPRWIVGMQRWRPAAVKSPGWYLNFRMSTFFAWHVGKVFGLMP